MFNGTGVDVILDHIGASYLKRNIESLNVDGRLFIIGTMGGSDAKIDLRVLLARRLTVQCKFMLDFKYHSFGVG
jgi:NADPH:quinone reductase-like Zn-dependent oxidoreductase